MSCEKATEKIKSIYSHPEIDECIKKFVSKEHREDFKQEVFLILLQIPCETIDKISGSLKYYIVRIILNLVRQQNNVFHKKYLDKTIEYNTDKLLYEISSPADVDTISERMEREEKELEIIERLKGVDLKLGNKSFPYHEKMIHLIADVGNMHRASIETGIPYTNVKRIVKKVRNKLQ